MAGDDCKNRFEDQDGTECYFPPMVKAAHGKSASDILCLFFSLNWKALLVLSSPAHEAISSSMDVASWFNKFKSILHYSAVSR